MDNVTVENMHVSMDDPEGGCIVQADDPQMLAAAAFEGSSAAPTPGNNSWYWSSMLKLMEQGAAAPSTTSAGLTNVHTSSTPNAHAVPMSQTQLPAIETTTLPITSSPSSSSVHDQPMDNMPPQNNAVSANDPDSSVWAQEFLSEPIGENMKSNLHLACSDDGLHELLYPRTVLELLFSDQLKLEQMPSWPDILLQQTLSSGSPGKSFSFPLTSSEKIMGGSTAAHDLNVNADNVQQLDIKFPQYMHSFSHLSGIEYDRLSSSTASSTLSDSAIDQWVPMAGSSGAAQCEHAMHAHQSSPLSNVHQIDPPARTAVRVKQEYSNVASPPFVISNDNNINNSYNPNMNNYMQQRVLNAGFDENAIMMSQEYEQKPSMINKLWNNVVLLNQANHDPLSHFNHKHHIYESITAANLSHNLRQLTGPVANGSGYAGMVDLASSACAAGHAATESSSHTNHSNQPSLQVGKKARPFSMFANDLQGGGLGSANTTGQAAAEPKKEMELDPKLPTSAHDGLRQQQLSGAETYNNNSKRSRIDQQSAPSPASTTSNSSSTSLKGQPIRKEKLSERITTLQQLVSPFGKTDTASVLLEAIGYIKFLQDQVQALSSPYFKSPSNQSGERNYNTDEGKPDLRSRGLCLVPLSCTLQVPNDNGADYWFGGAFR